MGAPFLGRTTIQGNTLYIDFENSLVALNTTLGNLARHAEIQELPPAMKIWSNSTRPDNCRFDVESVIRLIRETRPTLVVIDTMGYLFPQAENGADQAYAMFNILRPLTKEIGCAIVLVHHSKKPGTDHKNNSKAKALESTPVIEWMECARGSSALVNAIDVRLGVDRSRTIKMPSGEAAVVLKANGRLIGDTPVIYLARQENDSGKPIGYNRLRIKSKNPEIHAFYERLPESFRHNVASKLWGKSDSSFANCLRSMMEIDLVIKDGAVYRKLLVAD